MSHLSAIGLMCLAIFMFTFLDSTAKYLGEIKGLPILVVIWFRFFFHLVFLFLYLKPKRFVASFQTHVPKQQFYRTMSMVAATAFNFAALLYLQLDQTVTIFFLSPLIVAAIAGPFLGEWIGPKRLLAVVAGFVGVLVVMRPGFGGVHPAIIFSLISTFSVALYNVLTRYVTHHDSNDTNQLFSPLGGTLLLLPFALYYWQTPESIMGWVLLASLGITGGLGHWFLIVAHKYAPAPILAPFIYVGIIFMPIVGYLVFGDVPSLWTMAGASIVIASGFYLLYREARDRRPG